MRDFTELELVQIKNGWEVVYEKGTRLDIEAKNAYISMLDITGVVIKDKDNDSVYQKIGATKALHFLAIGMMGELCGSEEACNYLDSYVELVRNLVE